MTSEQFTTSCLQMVTFSPFLQMSTHHSCGKPLDGTNCVPWSEPQSLGEGNLDTKTDAFPSHDGPPALHQCRISCSIELKLVNCGGRIVRTNITEMLSPDQWPTLVPADDDNILQDALLLPVCTPDLIYLSGLIGEMCDSHRGECLDNTRTCVGSRPCHECI